jgi:hypothetical protein
MDKSREHDQTEADSPAGPEVPAAQAAPADGAPQSAPDGIADSAPQDAAEAAPGKPPRTRWSRPGGLTLGIGAAAA